MEDDRLEPYEYEVDLRDYVKVIWNQKWLIVGITVLAVALATGYSLRQPEVYETQATLMVTPRISEQIVGSEEEGLRSVSLPTSAYQQTALASDLLEEIIRDLELENKEGKPISTASLRSKMEVNVEIKDREEKFPLIKMTIRGTDPDRIKEIGNKWTELYQSRTTEIFASETARTFQFISERFQEVEEEINSLENKKQQYKEKNPLSSLKNQLTVLEENHSEFLSQLEQKRADLHGKEARLAELERQFKTYHPLETLEAEQLKSQYRTLLSNIKDKRRVLSQKEIRLSHLQEAVQEESQFLELQKTPSKEAFWGLLEGDLSESQLANLPDLTVKDEVENQLYFSLKNELNQTKVDINTLQENIPRLEQELSGVKDTLGQDLDQVKVTSQKRQNYQDTVWKEMSNLRAEVANLGEEVSYLKEKTAEFEAKIEEKQVKIDQVELKLTQLDRNINRLMDSYETLSSNLEETRIAKEEEESSIRVMEHAVAPERPLATNTKQNIAVAAVLGLFIGVLVAFFKNYMEEYEEEEEEEEETEE